MMEKTLKMIWSVLLETCHEFQNKDLDFCPTLYSHVIVEIKPYQPFLLGLIPDFDYFTCASLISKWAANVAVAATVCI